MPRNDLESVTMQINFSEDDKKFMKMALDIAETGIGKTDFAPSIGCVIVKNGTVIGKGRTSDGGVPHAEDNALQDAHANGHDPKGATAYVTLEPCAKADPGAKDACANLLINAGIHRMVAALQDPDHKTNALGTKMLKDIGIITEIGLYAEEAMQQNMWFYESRVFRKHDVQYID